MAMKKVNFNGLSLWVHDQTDVTLSKYLSFHERCEMEKWVNAQPKDTRVDPSMHVFAQDLMYRRNGEVKSRYRYYVYETENIDSARALIGYNDANEEPYEMAEAAAKHEWDRSDQKADDWPLTFVILEEGEPPKWFEIELEFDPTFSAVETEPENPDDELSTHGE
jgi:hypothetical protein